MTSMDYSIFLVSGTKATCISDGENTGKCTDPKSAQERQLCLLLEGFVCIVHCSIPST